MNDEVSELLKKAEQGDADAELRLGSAYCSRDGVEKSSSEAEKWWQRAAAHGSAGAARCLESLHQASHKSGESGAQNEDSEKLSASGIFFLVLLAAVFPATGALKGVWAAEQGKWIWGEVGVWQSAVIFAVIEVLVGIVFLLFSGRHDS